MDDLDHPPAIDLDDNRSIAVRRKRRSSSGLYVHSRNGSASSTSLHNGISTPPETPKTVKRSKKRVRFSDPGPIIQIDEASSGLTPAIRRASISSAKPSKRRHSLPTTLSNRAQYDEPLSGTLQFAPLRQVLDGRVKRRLKRNRLSEEVNNIEWDKRHQAKSKRLEVERLRKELEARDAEMQSMRDEYDIANQLEEESGASTTTSKLSNKVEELEQQISELKAELQRKEVDTSNWEDPDWTMAARDPFHDEDDDDFMITNYDDDFNDNDELMTTPTRLNISFPSPPSTTTDNSPCKMGSQSSAGVQASLPVLDPEKDAMKIKLEALQSEIAKLTSAVAFNEDNHSRLQEKLSEFMPVNESHDHSTLDAALDTVLTQLALTQSHALERSTAFSALTSEIANLGFPTSSNPDDTINTIAQQFRQARLDLEYLVPGENAEGFENEKLLEMLVSRIRVLLQKVKERDESIDQYHDQELLIRQQLNMRVDALEDVQKKLCLATSVMGDLRAEIEEKEVGNERLTAALEGYRTEVAGLEELIRRMEQRGSETEAEVSILRTKLADVEEKLQDEVSAHDTTRSCVEGNDILIAEYDRRLQAALQATSAIKEEMALLASSKDSIINEKETCIADLRSSGLDREREHGEALALRDAQVLELRQEIERVNEALQSAHATIMTLRRQNKELEAQVEGEKSRGRLVVRSMREQLSRVLDTGLGYLNGDVAVSGSEGKVVRMGGRNDEMGCGGGYSSEGMGDGDGDDTLVYQSSSSPMRGASLTPVGKPVVRSGGFLDGKLARRRSGKMKRRRYDSGLGFLEEGDETQEMDVGMDVGMGEVM